MPNTRSTSMRGQAAIEYVLTYGLGLVIVTAAVFSIMELDPLNMVSESSLSACEMGSNLRCTRDESVVNDDGRLTMSVQNTAGEPVKITKIKFSPDGQDAQLLEDDFSDDVLNVTAAEVVEHNLDDIFPSGHLANWDEFPSIPEVLTASWGGA